jgi:hypothetical protein
MVYSFNGWRKKKKKKKKKGKCRGYFATARSPHSKNSTTQSSGAEQWSRRLETLKACLDAVSDITS